MNLDDSFVSDSSTLSFVLTFLTKIKQDKLVIDAYCSNDNTHYVGKVGQHSNISFNKIREHLKQKDYKIFEKNQDLLKFKIQQIDIELYSLSKTQTMQLKEITHILIKRNQEFQQFIKNQTDEMQKLKDQMAQWQHKSLKENVKKSSQQQPAQFQNLVSPQNKENQDLKDQVLSLKIITSNMQQELTNMTKDLISQQMQKIAYLIKEFENETMIKMFEQSKKVSRNSGYIDSLVKDMKQVNQKLNNLTLQLNQQNVSKEQKQKDQQLNNISQENKYIFTSNKQQQHPFIWSDTLKSTKITINNNVATLTQKSSHTEYCLLDPPLSKTLNTKQSWAFKIGNGTKFIGFGIYLKSKILNLNFNDNLVDWLEINNGYYMISSGGQCFSHSQRNLNCVKKSFKFEQNDVIIIEYDPIEFKLRFNKNKLGQFEMPIIAPPQNDTYHPFVAFFHENNSVQLMLPESV